ncbi:MAG: lysophospholipid acyltransferase family protein [Rickettsiaceae bacterium]
MVKKLFKHHLKRNRLVHWMIVHAIFVYLKFVYITSTWHFIWSDKNLKINMNNLDGVLIALWHNRLAFGMHIFENYDNVYALASSHTDGKLITEIIKAMNYQVIEGSSNRNPTGAVRSIIHVIQNKGKVVITPDGPRGPVYKINSNITKIAYKYNKSLIPISCASTRYLKLKSWDHMIIPKPFGKIVVTIGEVMTLSGNESQDSASLEKRLMSLSTQSEQKCQEKM